MKIISSQNTIESKVSLSSQNIKILHLLWMHELYNKKALCSGVGKCGKCKIRFISPAPKPSQDENELLTFDEIDSNIRLSCKHYAKDEHIIELIEEDSQTVNNINDKDKNIKGEKYFLKHEKQENLPVCLAIDFGTTSLEYTLFKDSKVYAHGKILNPMQGIGSEVMARLEFAKSSENAKLLKNRTWQEIKNIVSESQNLGLIVEQIIFSANSAMTYLALGLESKSLATAPYSLSYMGGDVQHIEGLPPIFIPPLLAPFVGGDISSGLFALHQRENLSYPYLFVDMGTNAEFILHVSENENYMASVPLGPSVEGVGLTFGTVANSTSIVDFNLTPLGLKEILLDGKQGKAKGICGVGYLHLLQILSRISLIDKEGHFIIKPSMPLARKVAQFTESTCGNCLQLNHGIYLSGQDVESLLMVKAAFRTAFEILLDSSSINESQLQKVYVAGAFGKYLKTDTITDLGFLPHSLLSKIEQIGNSSLEGAQLLCTSHNQKHIKKIFRDYKHIELANHSAFSEIYMKHFNLE